MIVLVNSIYCGNEWCLLCLLMRSAAVFTGSRLMNVSRKLSVRANYVDNVKFCAKLVLQPHCHPGSNCEQTLSVSSIASVLLHITAFKDTVAQFVPSSL